VTKPVILTVDDDVAVLSAIERDLRQHYREDYRVMKASSGAEALEAAKELAARNRQVALFLVDQRMPGMSGTDMLREVKQLHPESRRVLLTAYADTDVAIAGINDIGLDHYLMKPWDPPEDRLYPVLDDLLGEWRAHVRPAFDGVRVFGSPLSPQSYSTKDFLSRNRVSYEWVDVDQDATARALAESRAGNLARLPIVFFPDGTHLVAPSAADLAAKVGMHTHATEQSYDVIIVGGGPAGLANAVYAASEGLRTVLVESHAPGGQAGTSSLIENYLGFPKGVTGEDLAQRAMAQARKFKAELVTGHEVVALRREDPDRVVVLTDGTELRAKCVVITTGMSARTLDVPGIAPLQGVCVFYGAAMTEAARYRDQDICIVGGANSAGQGALYFSRYAKSVTMLVRRDLQATMSHYLIEKIDSAPNIEVITGVEVDSLVGEKSLESVVLKACDTGERRNISASAMFIFIGVKPHADYFAGALERDEAGFIITGSDLPKEHGRPRGWPLERMPFMFETSIPGVFAAGDVRAGSNHRVAAAVGEGSATIHSVHRYLETV
jgi:thioredoxin reductase (NADPH)